MILLSLNFVALMNLLRTLDKECRKLAKLQWLKYHKVNFSIYMYMYTSTIAIMKLFVVLKIVLIEGYQQLLDNKLKLYSHECHVCRMN